MPKPPPPATTTAPSRPPARLPLGVIAAGSLTLATITGFAYLFALWAGSGDITPEKTLQIASAQYVAGNVVVAGDLAASVKFSDPSAIPGEDEASDKVNEPAADGAEARRVADESLAAKQKWVALQSFLVGAGIFEQGMRLESPRDRRELLSEALPVLLKSARIGFPEGRTAAGLRMIGLSAYHSGDYELASTQLQKAISADLTMRGELMPVLAIARARRPHDSLEHAIAAIEEYLSSQSLDAQKQAEAILLRIQWLTRLRRFDEAAEALANTRRLIQPALTQQVRWALNINDELVFNDAQLVIARTLAGVTRQHGERVIAGIPADADGQVSAQGKELLAETLKELAVLQREATPAVSARARIAAAQAFLLTGEDDLALAELTLVRQQRPFREEALEGGLSEMEVLAEQGRGDEVLQTARYLVREMGQSRHLNYTLKHETEFRSRVSQVLAYLRESGQFESVVETTDSVEPLFGKADASIEKGIAYRDWGDATLAAGRGRGGEISRDAFAAARAYYREAGDAFSIAAKEHFDTLEYIPTLWSAIDSYQRGRHFSKSIPMLEKYLRYEERLKQPAGLVAHGRALLAEGRPEEAMQSLQTCITEFLRDPMRYEARLLAAQAAADVRDRETAHELLLENLSDGQLTPQSPIWRDSLFTLGESIYAECDLATLAALALPQDEKITELRRIEPELQSAVHRLNEAVDRYWPLPRAQSASYMLARAQLLASRLPEAELENDALLDAARRDLRQKANRMHQSALDRFTSMIRFMDAQERDDDLSEKQHAILRNSLLGQADTLKAMGRYAEAAEAYREMSLRYLNEPPALEALLGQSRMLRLLGRHREADLLVSQALVVLDRIDAQWDERFEEMTRFSRGDWKNFLTWMSQRLDQAKRAAAEKNF